LISSTPITSNGTVRTRMRRPTGIGAAEQLLHHRRADHRHLAALARLALVEHCGPARPSGRPGYEDSRASTPWIEVFSWRLRRQLRLAADGGRHGGHDLHLLCGIASASPSASGEPPAGALADRPALEVRASR
jgi:hypothetical protein